MIKLFIEREFTSGLTHSHLVDDSGMDTKKIYCVGKNGRLIEHTVGVMTCTAPLMSIPSGIADEFVRLVAEYAQEKRVQSKKADWMEGAMNTMRAHLDREMLMVDRLMMKD